MPYKVENKRIEFRLGKVLNRMEISQREFSRLTGMRLATVNEIVNNKKSNLNFDHLLAIMCFFETMDFNNILEVVEVKEESDTKINLRI